MGRILVFLISILTTLYAFGFSITTPGTGELSWLTNGNACWRACFEARNDAINQMERQAGSICPNGYQVTQPAVCENDNGKDPSYLDHRSSWPVCVCNDLCQAEFKCVNNGQKPNFYPSAIEEWRKLRRAWRIQAYENNSSYKQMSQIKHPKHLLIAMQKSSKKSHTNIGPFLESYHSGQVEYVKAPNLTQLRQEFQIQLPILKSNYNALFVSSGVVSLQLHMSDATTPAYIFANGELIHVVEPTPGFNSFQKVYLEHPCLKKGLELEVVTEGRSEYVVVH